LLLADKQWGSAGKINYLEEAKRMIQAIMQHEINPKAFSILLSDAVEHDSKDYFDTRTSDFMPDHYRVFANATADSRWQQVIDGNYRLFSEMESRFSPDAGLVPDFIRRINKHATPAGPNYLESLYDGLYNYNACRVPWRIGTDYLLYGDKRAKAGG
jgi:endo-1,4-beta-D-glucanase Y